MNISKAITGFIAICLLSMLSACRRGQVDQEGNSLKIAKIGKQEWMAENLNVSHFRNGDAIPEVKTAEEWIRLGSEGKPAFRTDPNNPEYTKKYGKLYNWYAVNDPRGLAPQNWHVPSYQEWKLMLDYLGGEVATALCIRVTGYDENGNAISEIGLSGLPGGFCGGDGKFYGTGTNGYWWSASEISPETASIFQLNYLHCNMYTEDYYKAAGLSVKCVKD
jgi:uncharacterized protein (TIGR02145 family)